MATKSAPKRRTARATRSRPELQVLRPTLVGTDVRRLEGVSKVTGTATYVDDVVTPGVLHGFTVRSTIPYGRI